VTIGPDATPEDVQAFRDAYELGCAWAEAEAALPEGGRIEYVEWISPGYRAAASIMGEWFYGEGDTPAAALRALAERLRERTG
jgi:hypothetical protein